MPLVFSIFRNTLLVALSAGLMYPAFAPNPAVIPAERLSEPWWAARHSALLATADTHRDARLLLIGDSITNNYDKANPPDENFEPTWRQFYAPRKALNLGFSGDTTANVLWRLEHGEVDGLHPQAAIVLIGTNNTARPEQTVEQVESGIDAVVADLERRLPESAILLLGILPSAVSDLKTQKDEAVNRYLADCYVGNPRVTYLDIGSLFYKDGALKTEIFYDPRLPQHGKPLHPDTVGQRRMAEAIEPALAKLMNDSPQLPLESMTDINTASIPVPKLEMDSYDWYARHQAELGIRKTLQPRVVLIGDSITHFWAGPPSAAQVNGPAAWEHVFTGMPVLNMGFGWDRTQNVLWRLRQGELEGLHPDWIVINIGTNNLTSTNNARANTPAEIAEGILAVYREVRKESPASRIVVMGIFPRGAQGSGPLRAPIQQTNRLLAQRFSNDHSVTYLDIGGRFLQGDGSLPAALMPDGTHPSDAGYDLWAEALLDAGVKP